MHRMALTSFTHSHARARRSRTERPARNPSQPPPSIKTLTLDHESRTWAIIISLLKIARSRWGAVATTTTLLSYSWSRISVKEEQRKKFGERGRVNTRSGYHRGVYTP